MTLLVILPVFLIYTWLTCVHLGHSHYVHRIVLRRCWAAVEWRHSKLLWRWSWLQLCNFADYSD